MNDKIELPHDEPAYWQAILTRDARYNNLLYYGVRSTGIYCRPTCPARRPRREQVVFFENCDSAEAAGFRPCRRCLPRQQNDPALELVTRARTLIEQAEDELTLHELGEQLGTSPFHLQRTFKAILGVSPREYAAAMQAREFKTQVRSGQDVTRALYEAGYGSNSRLYETANGYLGMTPGAYRKGGKGMKIRYTVIDCKLGRLMLAASERGICAVTMGDSDGALISELAKEFPEAKLIRSDLDLVDWATALREHLAGTRPDLDLPLDVLGTAFQQRVWAELRRIPYGQTRTYTQIAEAIGQPSAARAVARACATNPAALVTPCHRVIRGDGTLGGYRWGMPRKQTLLEQEKA